MRNRTLTIYCSLEEAEAIRRAAHMAKRSVSDYIVTVALERILGTRRTRNQLQQAIERVNNTQRKVA